ncbi:hypothetical protein ACIBH1_39855 [Nonomuraea sp. NPDC050663]|uniref:hypothetical protein n=1 Tax=Nonomuraea sp. NPDC050663 TaxID=3364370 RepID=UPI0037B64BDA
MSKDRPDRGVEDIDWSVPVPRANRIRVCDFTSDMQPVFYELCMAAGLMFIRRFCRRETGMVVHESPWMRTEEARNLWARLLNGECR